MGKTKAEEREALTKIREILSGLGDDSYVGKAFEGCVEQADENIRNDWMLSWKGQYLDEQAENCKYAEKVGELTRQLNQKDDTIARLEDAKNQLSEEIDGLTLAKRDLEARIAQMEADYKALQINHEELKQTRAHTVAQELVDLRQTVLELKAKLYDMMTGEEVSG